MQLSTRRSFLKTTLFAPAAISVSRALAIDPIPRSGPPQFKLSLAAYGFRKYLDLKKPAEPRMDYFQFADLAASLGLGAIEATSYYFPETTPTWLSKFKNHCTRLGLDISATAVGNDFCVADAGKRNAEIKKVKEWLDISGFLGAKAMRVFAGTKPKDDSEEAARQRCIAALQEVSEYAGKVGVFVAVENHGGITATPEQLLAIVKHVHHDWFGVNLDTHNFRTADPYGDVAKIAPYAVNVQMKTEMSYAGQKQKQEADLPRLFDFLKAAGYRGYVALEYEAAEDPKTAVPRYVKRMQEIAKCLH
jgi:sugar phosphate isomerase/epimerase